MSVRVRGQISSKTSSDSHDLAQPLPVAQLPAKPSATLPAKLPAKVPTELPTELTAELLAKLPAKFPAKLSNKIPKKFQKNFQNIQRFTCLGAATGLILIDLY